MTQPPVSTVSHAIPKLYLLTNDDEFSLLYQKLEAALATGLGATAWLACVGSVVSVFEHADNIRHVIDNKTANFLILKATINM